MRIQLKSEHESENLFYNHCVKTQQDTGEYKPHYHNMYEVLFLKEGSVSYLVEDKAYPLRKNSLILTRPNQRHCIRIDADVPYDRYDLLFSQDFLDGQLLAKIPDALHVISFEANQLVIQLFEKMDFYCEKLSGEELTRLLRSLTEEVLVNVLIQTDPKNGDPGIHPLTRRALAYMDDNLLSIRGVDDVCAALSMSKSYLYKLFLSDLNTTPKQYIMERRLNLARREILLGAKATVVFAQCGFADYSAFFRAYKKHFGYSPAVTQQSALVRVGFQDVVKGSVE